MASSPHFSPLYSERRKRNNGMSPIGKYQNVCLCVGGVMETKGKCIRRCGHSWDGRLIVTSTTRSHKTYSLPKHHLKGVFFTSRHNNTSDKCGSFFLQNQHLLFTLKKHAHTRILKYKDGHKNTDRHTYTKTH